MEIYAYTATPEFRGNGRLSAAGLLALRSSYGRASSDGGGTAADPGHLFALAGGEASGPPCDPRCICT